MASLSRTRLRLLALAAVLALACTRPGDDGVDKDPPNDETDTDVAPTGDTSAGRDTTVTDDTSDSDTSTVTPCDLSTPRILKATEQLHWFTGDDVQSYTGVLDGWDPAEGAIVFARWEVMSPGTLGGTTHWGRARLYEGDTVAQATPEHEFLKQSPDSTRYVNTYDWRSPDLHGDGRRDAIISNGPHGSTWMEHDTLRLLDSSAQGFIADDEAPMTLKVPGGLSHRRYSVGEYDGVAGLDLLVSMVDPDDPSDADVYQVHAIPQTPGTHTLSNPIAAIDMEIPGVVEGGYFPAVDVDADGIHDVLAWRREVEGENPVGYLFYGPVSGNLTVADADASFRLADHHAVDFFSQNDFGMVVEGGRDFDGDGVPDLAFAADGVDDARGLVAVLRGPFQGDYTTDDAWLSVRGVEDRADADIVGRDAFFLQLDDGPYELVVATGYRVPSSMASPTSRWQRLWGAFLVYDHTQSGELAPEDAKVMVVNDGIEQIASWIDPLFGDVDGDGHDDVMFAGAEAGVIPKLCP